MWAHRTLHKACVACLLAGLAIAVRAAEPRGWRGDGTGSYPEASPATTWSADKNVIWKTAMPSWGNSSPVMAGSRLFVCAEPEKLVCVDTTSGKILWQKSSEYLDALSEAEAAKARADMAKAGKLNGERQRLERQLRKLKEKLKKGPPIGEDLDEYEEARAETEAEAKELEQESKRLHGQITALGRYQRPATHGANGYSTPTPVTDGELVCALFGTGVAAAFGLDGSRKWTKLLPKPTQGWGHSASPVLVGERFIAHVGNEVIALHATTGEELWRQRSGTHWGSPVHARIGTVDVLVTPGGDVIRVKDGHALARVIGKLTYNAPIAKDGVVYFVDGEQRTRAVKLLPQADGTLWHNVLWDAKITGDRYYASPTIHNGLVYGLNQQSALTVLDAKTGEVVYTKNLSLGGTAYPSIAAAGKYVFVSSDSGVTAVLQAGREYREVARSRLEGFRSCPVFLGQRMYVRGLKHLYCIGSR